MSTLETIATIVAGIGLFFSGIKILSNSMKNLASHRFRLLIAKWTNNPILAAFWGFASGMITQSSSNTVFILVGLVRGGLIGVRAALPVVIWSSVGTTVLIFLVAINIKLGILILVGFSGIFFGFDKGSRRESLYAALFGISLLLFGFQELKSGSTPFAQMEFIRDIFQYAKDSYFVAILIGIVLRLLIHSSTTIAVLIMTISHSGLIGLDQVMLMIFSMSFGEALSLYLMSSTIKGVSKQIVIFKVVESIAASALLLIVSSIEIGWHIPLTKYVVSTLGSTIEQQTAISFLILKSAPVFILSFLYGPIYRILVKLSPPTEEEGLSETKYITERSLADVSTALILVENEQIRIFERFSKYIDNIRSEKESELAYDFFAIRNSNVYLISEIDSYLKSIVNLNLSSTNSEIYLLLQNRQTLLKSIDETVFSFVSTLFEIELSDALENLIQNSSESLHVNFITAFEATKSKDQFDVEILLKITGDKGPVMEKIRKNHLAEDQVLNPGEKVVLLYTTDLFQRTIWLLNNWAKSINTELQVE